MLFDWEGLAGPSSKHIILYIIYMQTMEVASSSWFCLGKCESMEFIIQLPLAGRQASLLPESGGATEAAAT